MVRYARTYSFKKLCNCFFVLCFIPTQIVSKVRKGKMRRILGILKILYSIGVHLIYFHRQSDNRIPVDSNEGDCFGGMYRVLNLLTIYKISFDKFKI